VRDKALRLIFEDYRNNPNILWPIGQLFPLCHDNLMSVTTAQCVADLLQCKTLTSSLICYVAEIKNIYDYYKRNTQIREQKVIGWYWHELRDKEPKSWKTALVLNLFYQFSRLLSSAIEKEAIQAFQINYRTTDIKWKDLYDSSAVKSKLRLMFNDNATDNPSEIEVRYKTAILFGPPGTGKTTYARALATKLSWAYLELTPSDFYSGGQEKILTRINEIFEKLLHLRKTVVFIDEIDDLVRSRRLTSSDPNKREIYVEAFDPRILYVNTLLPRFQELHDKGNILLIMATNNYDKVDNAISRLGRIDLVIPVGGISPHGRLKILYSIVEECPGALQISPTNNDLVDYLERTENMSYPYLKLYMKNVIDELGRGRTITEVVQKSGLKHDAEIEKFCVKDSVLWTNTRPLVKASDMSGYRDLDSHEKPNFVKLFQNLRRPGQFNKSKAREVARILTGFIVKGQENKAGCYGMITPFYDDLEMAVNATPNPEVKSILQAALFEVSKIVYERQMLE
jgi:DNA replication protein DnaC